MVDRITEEKASKDVVLMQFAKLFGADFIVDGKFVPILFEHYPSLLQNFHTEIQMNFPVDVNHPMYLKIKNCNHAAIGLTMIMENKKQRFISDLTIAETSFMRNYKEIYCVEMTDAEVANAKPIDY